MSGTCRFLVYARGAFISADETACRRSIPRGQAWQPFDDQARADLDALVGRSQMLGRRLLFARPVHDIAGRIRGGTFNLGGSTDYVLTWGRGALDDPYRIGTAIDARWHADSAY